MKILWNEKYTTISMYAFITAAASFLFIAAVINIPFALSFIRTLLNILSPFWIGFGIAFILNPAYIYAKRKIFAPAVFLKTKPRTTKILSLISVYILFTAALAAFFIIIVPNIIHSLLELFENSIEYFETANKSINKISGGIINLNKIITPDKIQAQIHKIDAEKLSDIAQAAADIITMVLNFLISIVVSFYMLYNKEQYIARAKKAGTALLPNKIMTKLTRLIKLTSDTFSSYISGVIIVALIVAVMTTASMHIANIPFALLIGVIIGITNTIPYLGPYIGGIPSVLLVLGVNPSKAIWAAVILIIIQQIDASFIEPKIVGKKTGLSALLVIFAIILGGGFFGITGMLLAVPAFSVVYTIVKGFINDILKKKNLPTDTRQYL